MDEANRCHRCGTPLVDQTSAGALCPACLLALGLSGAIPAYTEPSTLRRRWLRPWAIILALTALLALILATLVTSVRRTQPKNRVVRFSIPSPEEAEFAREDGGTHAALSPDGRWLAFSAATASGTRLLWTRELSGIASNALSGAEGASMPFWSPDSQYIGFFAQGKLKVIPARGGSVRTMCDAPRPRGAAWSREGTIVFAPNAYGGLFRVPAAGSAPRQATQVDHAKGTMAHRWPSFLPGEQLLYTSVSIQPGKASIVVEVVGRPQSKVILEDAAAASYADGYLLYVRSNALMAQRFDAKLLQFAGDPKPVPFVERIESGAHRFPGFAAANGIMAYPSERISQTQLAWRDRNGRVLAPVGDPGEFGGISLSPDGTTLALARRDAETSAWSLWLLDLARGTNMRMTFDRRTAIAPVWSPDGQWIAYSVENGSSASLHKMRANGTGGEQTLVTSADWNTVDCWSADGRFLVYTARDREGKSALWMLPMAGDGKPQPLLQIPFRLEQAQLSQDGRWLAYVSDESGRDEIYVQAFPLGGGGKWQISANGGTDPRWSGRSGELLFVSLDRQLMAAPVQPRAAELRPGVPVPLFRLTDGRFYAVSNGGERILAASRPDEPVPSAIQVVLNWADELQR